MLSLSQVILGVHDLDLASVGLRRLGLDVLEGGRHPGVGTANRIVPLGAGYLELLAVVDETEAQANDYARSLIAAIAEGDRLVRWSLRTDRITEVASRLGLTVEKRFRRLPDGSLLTWRAAGLSESLADSSIPFFMEWDDPRRYPGLMTAEHDCGATHFAWVEIAPPDAERFAEWTSGIDAPLRLTSRGRGLERVAIQTRDGEVVLPT